MATKTTIAIDVNLTAGQAADELDKISQAGDEASKSISKLQAEALKAEKALAGVGANERAEAITKTSEALVGGFQAATGAMALFGQESEEVQKAMMKAQSAFLIADGIKKVTEGIGKMRVAFDALKVALLSNPLLGLAAAIVAITAAVYAWLTAESDLAEEIKKTKELEKKRFEDNERSYDRQIERARALGKETVSLERQKQLAALEQAKTQLELDKRLEKSNLKQAQSRIYLMSLTNSTFKKTYDTITKALDNFDAYSQVAFEEQNNAIQDIEERLSNDRLKMIIDINTAIVKSTEDRYKKEQELADKAKTEREKRFKEEKDAYYKMAGELEEPTKKVVKSIEEPVKELKTLSTETTEATQQATEDMFTMYEAFTARSQQFADFLGGKFGEVSNGLTSVAESGLNTAEAFFMAAETRQLKAAGNNQQKQEQIKKKFFERNKKLQIAQTTIDTFQSAVAAYRSLVGTPFVGPVIAPLAAGAAIASGFATIAKIKAQTFEGGGGAGNPTQGINIPDMDVSGGSQPTFGSTELNRQAIESGKSITIENNISETEITKKQQRVGVIQSRATID